MAYRALRSFSGILSMVKGEVRDIANEAVAKDLLRSGYVEDLGSTEKKTAKASKPKETKKE